MYELGGLVDADGQWWGGGSGKGRVKRWFDFGGKAGEFLDGNDGGYLVDRRSGGVLVWDCCCCMGLVDGDC